MFGSVDVAIFPPWRVRTTSVRSYTLTYRRRMYRDAWSPIWWRYTRHCPLWPAER